LIKSLEPFLDSDGKKLEKLLNDFTVAVAAARAQEDKYKSAESARMELLKALEAVK
jgi:hypothetical protein